MFKSPWADTFFLYWNLQRDKMSWKYVGGVIILVYCTLSDNLLHLRQVSWKYLKGFQSYNFTLKFTKKHISVNVGGVMVLVSAHCLLILILVPSFVKISKRVSELLRRDAKCDGQTVWRTDGQRNGQTNRQTTMEKSNACMSFTDEGRGHNYVYLFTENILKAPFALSVMKYFIVRYRYQLLTTVSS